MSDYKIVDAFEQMAVFDGEYKLAIDGYLLMNIVNHMGTYDEGEIEEMKNPKRLAVRVTIEVKEMDL